MSLDEQFTIKPPPGGKGKLEIRCNRCHWSYFVWDSADAQPLMIKHLSDHENIDKIIRNEPGTREHKP